jgi:hypothetical protein
MKILQTIGVILLTLILSACGGGGSSACGSLLSNACTSISGTNAEPIANAGTLQNVSLMIEAGVLTKLVTLDGTGSSDSNSDPLTFKWTLTEKPAGSAATLSSSVAPKPTFTADLVGIYKATLIVNDGKSDSTASTVVINAAINNSAPVANAGAKQNVVTGAPVTLDGTYSTDADNNQLTYSWQLMQKPTDSTATLTNPKTSRPTFNADKAGDYVAQLIVNDGYVASAPATVIIVAAAANVAPVANAGDDQNVSAGTLVRLDGTLSTDANFDALTYKWDWMSQPSGSSLTLSSSASPKPTFTPLVAGTYVLTLTVNDGKLSSSPDPITITTSTANSAPVAVAGADQNMLLGDEVTLDGTSSTDANGDTLTYKWTLSKPSGSLISLSSDSVASPTFTPDVSGVYVASLVVNDTKSYSANQSLTRITVSSANVAPVASAGTAQTITGATLVTLSGTGSSDANGDTLSYKWYLTTKPAASTTASLALSTTSAPTFTPDAVGVYVVTLIVNDGKVDSTPSTVTITRGS